MKQFILTVLCVGCMGFVGCSGGVPEDNNSISDNSIITVIDCPECRDELNKINQTSNTNNYNSAAVMADIMQELENNFTAAGFTVVRDDFNHITIK